MNFVLVHGGWCGGWWMSRLARALRQRGAEVYAPTLTGLGERVHLATPDVGLSTHIEDILGVLHYEDLRDVVLVGHSYGGAVVTGVADRARDRIQRLIYFDAFVLRNGESMADVGAPGMAELMLDLARLQGEGWRTPSPFTMEQFGVDDPADMDLERARDGYAASKNYGRADQAAAGASALPRELCSLYGPIHGSVRIFRRAGEGEWLGLS